jgi:hypothetical protein
MANRTYHPRGLLVDGVRAQAHPLYTTWANMLSRCYNPDAPGYENYGGRGIRVDPAWHHFACFARDMGAKPGPELTLERKNNALGYSKHNCKWDTRSNQCVNRRTFKNNTSGYTGVVPVNGRFEARFDYEKQRYPLGRFDTAEAAAEVRSAFVGLFFADRSAALGMISDETVWCTSTTKVRGVTPHKDGGYIARCTVKGERKYLGYYQTVEEAAAAIAEAKNG